MAAGTLSLRDVSSFFVTLFWRFVTFFWRGPTAVSLVCTFRMTGVTAYACCFLATGGGTAMELGDLLCHSAFYFCLRLRIRFQE